MQEEVDQRVVVMIENCTNNGPRQSAVAEQEPKAKEERPSILERLKQPIPKQGSKTAPHRSAEREI